MKTASFLGIVMFLAAAASGIKLMAKPDGLYYNGKKVFLSGVNIAWNWYGYDFGNNQVKVQYIKFF